MEGLWILFLIHNYLHDLWYATRSHVDIVNVVLRFRPKSVIFRLRHSYAGPHQPYPSSNLIIIIIIMTVINTAWPELTSVPYTDFTSLVPSWQVGVLSTGFQDVLLPVTFKSRCTPHGIPDVPRNGVSRGEFWWLRVRPAASPLCSHCLVWKVLVNRYHVVLGVWRAQ